MRYVELGCRVIVGLVLAVAVFGKVRSRQHYREYLAAVRMFAPSVAGRGALVALVLIGGEVGTMLLLAVDRLRFAGYLLGGVLLSAFTVAVASALHRRRLVSCRCFGAANATIGGHTLVRNGVLLAAAVVGAAATAGSPSVDSSADPAAAAVAGAAGVVIAFLLIRFDDVAHLVAGPPGVDQQTRRVSR